MKERNKLVPPLSFDSTCLFPSVLSRSFRLKYLPAAICSLSLFFFLWKRRSCSTLEMASPKSLCQHNTLLPYIPLAGPAHELPARIFVNYIIVHIYNDEKQSKRKTVCSDRELSLEYKHSTKQKIERWGTHTHVRIVLLRKGDVIRQETLGTCPTCSHTWWSLCEHTFWCLLIGVGGAGGPTFS